MIRWSPLVALALAACVADRPAPPAVEAPRTAAAAEPKPPARAELSLPDTASEPAPPAPGDDEAQAREIAKRKIDEGDFAGALEVLARFVDEDELASWNAILRQRFSDPYVLQASAYLLDGRPEEAFKLTSKALVAAPGDPRALVAHGEANLQLGVLGSSPKLIKDALDSFRLAGETPEALFGAARAARELGRPEEALEHAREGWSVLRATPRVPQPWPEEPERTLAQALWDVFEPATRESLAPEHEALAEETYAAWIVWLALSPGDEGAWTHAADVDARRGRKREELVLLERGLAALPGNTALAERIERVAREIGGDPAVIEAFEEVRRWQPECALAWWHAGRVRFDRAISDLAKAPVTELREAEDEFEKARALDPGLRGECLRHEALCRAAKGWIAVDGGRLGDAADRFRSMQQLLPGGMRLEVPGKLKSGLLGLAAVAEAYGRKDELAVAARLYLELHKYHPESREWAMLAGAFKRDAGRELEVLANDCKLAASGAIADGRLKGILERAGIDGNPSRPELTTQLLFAEARIRDEAQEHFKTSYGCYRDAWRFDPGDARAMIEGGAVAIEDLDLRPADREEARSILTRARRLAAERLEEPGRTEELTRELRDQFADASEYLGIYHLEIAGEPKQALAFFQDALTSPQPNPAIRSTYIPRCNALLRRN